MELYYLIYLLQTPFLFIKKQKKIYIFFVSVYFIMSFIRWETGTDWESYKYYFFNIETHSWLMERGYGYLNLIIYKISNNYTILLFFVGFLIYTLKYSTVYKYSLNPMISLIAAFSLQRGDIFFVRQNLAFALIFFSVRFIIERKKFSFIILILIASSIHSSSLIFLPAYYIFNLKIKNISLIFFISALLGVFLKQILIFFSNTLFSGTYLGYKMVRYIGEDLSGYGGGRTFFEIIFRSTINRAFLLIVFFFLFKKMRENDKLLNGFLNLYLISFIIFVTFGSINLTLTRLSSYYEQFQIILFSYLIYSLKEKEQRNLIVIILLIYLLLRLKLDYLGYYNELIPYKTIFQR